MPSLLTSAENRSILTGGDRRCRPFRCAAAPVPAQVSEGALSEDVLRIIEKDAERTFAQTRGRPSARGGPPHELLFLENAEAATPVSLQKCIVLSCMGLWATL